MPRPPPHACSRARSSRFDMQLRPRREPRFEWIGIWRRVEDHNTAVFHIADSDLPPIELAGVTMGSQSGAFGQQNVRLIRKTAIPKRLVHRRTPVFELRFD